MYTEKKRTVIIMMISVVMNLFLFLVAYYFKLPLWLDTTGTIYASVLLGAPAGFVVAIANNLIQAFGFYGAESLMFYIVSALTAFIAGRIMENKKRNIKMWLILAICIFAICSFTSVILTFITTKGIPADYWGSAIYWALIKKDVVPVLCTVISVLSVKFLDVVASTAIAMLSICFTPKAIKSNVVTIKSKIM